MDRVNVLICNHNYAKWIQSSVNSVVNQDYENKAITLVDDASTDESVSLIVSMLDSKVEFEDRGEYLVLDGTIKSVPIKIISLKSNYGPSTARNAGIDLTLAETDIYAILDADDEFLQGKISRLVQEMNLQPMIGIVYADYIIHDVKTGFEHVEYKKAFSQELLMNECIIHSGAFIKKQALIDVVDEFGYYDQTMRCVEDYDLWTRITEKYMAIHVPEPLTLVRVHPQNSTSSVDNSIWQLNWQRLSTKLQLRRQNVQ
jgi:glycosyltransferase involved in cell wall biosynthesis